MTGLTHLGILSATLRTSGVYPAVGERVFQSSVARFSFAYDTMPQQY